MQTDFKLYKVDMKYIRNLHNIDDKVLSVLPQAGKDNRVFIGIVVICGIHKYCISLSSPKEKHKNMKNSMDFSKIEVNGNLLGVLNFNHMISIEEEHYSLLIPPFLREIGKISDIIRSYVLWNWNGVRRIMR